MKKKTYIGKIKPSQIKTRDIVHMQEFLHGSGGPHKSKKDKQRSRQQSRKDERQDPNQD